VKETLDGLLLLDAIDASLFLDLLGSLPSTEQRNVLYAILKIASKEYFSLETTTEANSKWWQSDMAAISAVAQLVNLVVDHNDGRKQHLVSWLMASGAGIGEGVAIRRATVAVLARDKSTMELMLEKNLQQLGDKLYIRHTPIMQQEGQIISSSHLSIAYTTPVQAQVLLLIAGYIHRNAPLSLTMIIRSGAHLNVVSNRLAASSPRARFLGMVIGEALSSLVDKEDKMMDFKVDEMKTDEANWYKSLVHVSDSIGSLEPLTKGVVASKQEPAHIPRKLAKPVVQSANSKIISIEEIETDEEESDDSGLTPYTKPDSDVEDSDDDPTLITRNRPTAPVYIRDLILFFRDTENYDKQKLALSTAASLIRRKANFGTEVTAHAEELAALLTGLQDKYDMENFQDMRLQGMIAVLLALPLKMGQWFSKTFFDGDYSISQRAAVLTTLGLGARELGGFGPEDASLTVAKPLLSTSFPSKVLPPKMHKVYAQSSKLSKDEHLTPLSTLSTNLENTMIAPLATSLADKLTGPSILKIRTFSSRMAVEKARTKPTTNALAKVVAEGYFFPLTGRFFMHLKAYGSSSSNNITFQPYLLTLFIKTLALLLHASGPSTLSLPQMTSEFWDLLLGIRGQSIGDITVMEALLFGFLTILEVNSDKRALVDSFGRQMMETREWVEEVFDRMGSGGGEEDERVRMLAAGVLVRIGEVAEKYQALLMGLG
jgi:telomere length regulation protein